MREHLLRTAQWLAAALLIGVVIVSGPAAAQEPYYKGKTIRIVVGFTAGGGFDAYSRALARHMPRHILGNPTIVVENMPGAGSLISANYLYKIAKPDGLTIGHFIGGLLLGQVLGQKGVEFDARKFEYIGAPVYEHPVCATTTASGITSLEKWMASPTPVKMGGVAPGASNPDNITRAARATIGLPTQIVTGYKGTAEIRLAAESGELAGACWGWGSLRATWRKGLDAREVQVVLQITPKPHPDLPNVPLAIIARMTRSSLLEVLRQDYVRTARAKGVTEQRVVSRHALKNAFIPVVTVIGLNVGSLLGGAILTETIFAWPGVGRLVVDSIFARDYPIVQGAVLVIAILFVLINLLVDLSYAYLDPRIRYG